MVLPAAWCLSRQSRKNKLASRDRCPINRYGTNKSMTKKSPPLPLENLVKYLWSGANKEVHPPLNTVPWPEKTGRHLGIAKPLRKELFLMPFHYNYVGG